LVKVLKVGFVFGVCGSVMEEKEWKEEQMKGKEGYIRGRAGRR